jgi:hypothetical protein
MDPHVRHVDQLCSRGNGPCPCRRSIFPSWHIACVAAGCEKTLKGKDLHKPIYEKEMMEILHALKKWHPYLIGRHFKVKTDHDSLKYFLEQRLSLEEQQKWVTKILGYDFEIVYKSGKQNVVADAISRKDEDVETFLCVISIIQPNWII